MINITGTLTVQDDNGKQYTYNAEDLGFEPTFVEERQMGPATTWAVNYNNDDVQIDITIEEYPDGFPNSDFEIDINGGILIKNNLSAENVE